MPIEDGEWDEGQEEQWEPWPEGRYPLEDQPTTDEADLGTQSPGPGSVEQDSAPSTEPHGATQAEASASEDTDPPVEFDPRVSHDFEGLLYLGRLTDEFEWFGHRFVIRTLTTGELMEVGLMHKEYTQSLADVKAYQALVVAASLVTVDGKSLPLPISNDSKVDSELINKFRYIRDHWYPVTLDAVYERLLLLEARVNEVIEAMAKAHGWTASTRTLSGTAV